MVRGTLFEDSDSASDSISVATDWTEASEIPEDGIYKVDCILSERGAGRDKEYLIRWKDYPLERSTWEPLANIEDRSILTQWAEKQSAIRHGFADPFDVKVWEAAQIEIERSRSFRHEKRRKKRAMKGLPPEPLALNPSEELDEEAEAEDDEDDDVPLVHLKRRSRPEPDLEGFVVPDNIRDIPNSGGEASKRIDRHNTNHLSTQPISHALAAGKGKSGPASPTEIASSSVSKQQAIIPSNKPLRRDSIPSSRVGVNRDTSKAVPMGAKKSRGKSGAAIMANWTSEPPAKRKRARPEGHSAMYNLSAKWNAEKAGRTEVAPDSNHIVLTKPSDILKAPTGILERRGSENLVAVSRGSRTNEPATVQQSNESEPNPRASSVPLSCYYWNANLPCPLGVDQCLFTHSAATKVANIELHIQSTKPEVWPKFQDPVVVCSFWHKGIRGCFRADSECYYAHWLPINGRHVSSSQDKPQKTCHFWLKGGCNKSAGECAFAHELLSTVAQPPGFRPVLGASTLPPNIGLNTHSPILSPNFIQSDDSGMLPTEGMQPRSPTSRRKSIGAAPPWVQNQAHLHTEVAPRPLEASLRLPEEHEAIRIQLISLTSTAEERLVRDFTAAPQFTLANMCIRENLETFVLPCATTVMSSGDIVALEGAQNIARLANLLVQHRTAAVIKGISTLMIIYPNQPTNLDWAFLGRSTPTSPKSCLSFQLRASRPGSQHINQQPAPKSGAKNIERLFEGVFGVKREEFFSWPMQGGVRKNVIIMAPPEYRAEAEMMIRYFREIGCRVWLGSVRGAWDSFRAEGQGVVVFHQTIFNYGDIPHLSDVLIGRFNFFELGIDLQDPNRKFQCKQLFSNGTTVFITDELFAHHPVKALEVVSHVIKKNEGKPRGFETWRIYARPKLKEWLFDLANKHDGESEQLDDARAKLCYHISELDSASQGPSPNSLPDALIASSSFLVDHAEQWEQDPAAATDTLVHAFSSVACINATHCRRWVVVHPENTSSPCGKQYHNHLISMTPGKYLGKFSR